MQKKRIGRVLGRKHGFGHAVVQQSGNRLARLGTERLRRTRQIQSERGAAFKPPHRRQSALTRNVGRLRRPG